MTQNNDAKVNFEQLKNDLIKQPKEEGQPKVDADKAKIGQKLKSAQQPKKKPTTSIFSSAQSADRKKLERFKQRKGIRK